MEATMDVHTSAAPTLSSIDVLSNIVVKSAQGSSRTETSGSYAAGQYADETHRVDVGGVYECSTQPLTNTPTGFDKIMRDLMEIRAIELPVPSFVHNYDDDDFQQPKPLKKYVVSDPRLRNASKRRQQSKPRDSDVVSDPRLKNASKRSQQSKPRDSDIVSDPRLKNASKRSQQSKPRDSDVVSDPRLKNASKRRQQSKPWDTGKVNKSRSCGSVTELEKLLTCAPASGIRNGDVDAMIKDITNCPALLSPIPSSGSVSGSHDQQTEATPILNSGIFFETCFKYLNTVEERAGGLEKSINSRSEEIGRLMQKLCELEAANSQEQFELDNAKKVIGTWKEGFIHMWAPS